jgi:hypothetical protein
MISDGAGQERRMPGREADIGGEEDFPLLAYRVTDGAPFELTTAPLHRDWMDATDRRFANRCLPLLMANQAGWLLLSEHTFTARWSGGRDQAAIEIRPLGGDGACPAVSHFGNGILTFQLPFLFRTPPGWNLLVRGPANRPKDGIAPLEGLVEADWASSTFTMNWQITRPGVTIEFRREEPVCMIVPQRRGELERFRPMVAGLSDMPDAAGYLSWRQRRQAFLDELAVPQSAAARAGWQRDYMSGTSGDGRTFAGHQRRLRLHDWVQLPGGRRDMDDHKGTIDVASGNALPKAWPRSLSRQIIM